ncbi:MAG: ribosome maturation factor RimM [Holosporales bacterium]|jgi:16S rRNA processing protein RimM|nr:ribosome maturation factor RimM [Holosporales bacterium]
MKSNLVCVGMIAKPVGVRGLVKIVPYTVSPHSFLQFRRFLIADGVALTVESPKINNVGEIITRLIGYETRDDVEQFRLKHLCVRRSDLPSLPNNEYYVEDLRGLSVLNEEGKSIGIVNTVLDYGAGAFLDINLAEARGPATIPFNCKSILDVNLERGRIIVADNFVLY